VAAALANYSRSKAPSLNSRLFIPEYLGLDLRDRSALDRQAD